MNYITSNLNPRPRMSVKLKNSPPVNDFKRLFVTWADCGFFVFAATAADIKGVAIFKPDVIKLSQVFLVPLKSFCSLLLIDPPSSRYWWGVNVMIFWHPHLGLGHLSCSLSISPSLLKSVHAVFDIDEQWFLPHLPLLIKSSPRVIYSVKICDLLRPQILQVPLITLTSFLVLGLTFSYTFSLTIWLNWRPPKQYVCFEFIYINIIYS